MPPSTPADDDLAEQADETVPPEVAGEELIGDLEADAADVLEQRTDAGDDDDEFWQHGPADTI